MIRKDIMLWNVRICLKELAGGILFFLHLQNVLQRITEKQEVLRGHGKKWWMIPGMPETAMP